MKKLLLFGFALLTSCLAFAQAPQAFNYQGVARDLAGTPLANRNISLRISILESDPGGNIAYQELHAVTTNDLGLFQLKIGQGTPMMNEFSDVSWGSGDHYIQTEMDEKGGTNYQLLGANQLLSVPYALHAENASPWEQISDGIRYDEKVNIGLLSPTFWNYDLNIRRNNQDNVGIQLLNTNPTGRSLVLAGESNLGRYVYMGYLNSNYQFQNTGAKQESALFFTGAQNGMTFMSQRGDVSFVVGGLTSNDQRFLISTNGNVGIGTPEPSAKLEVANGDIYIEQASRGVIMTSPNGQCWRMTVSDSGEAVFNSIACPN